MRTALSIESFEQNNFKIYINEKNQNSFQFAG